MKAKRENHLKKEYLVMSTTETKLESRNLGGSPISMGLSKKLQWIAQCRGGAETFSRNTVMKGKQRENGILTVPWRREDAAY